MENKELDCYQLLTFNQTLFKRKYPISMLECINETEEDKCNRFMRQLNRVITSCSLCQRGRKLYKHKNSEYDPHILSSFFYKPIVIISKEPDELDLNGLSNRYYKIIKKYKLNKDDFYFTTLTKCVGSDNYECPFFKLELQAILKCVPKLIITINFKISINGFKIINTTYDKIESLFSLISKCESNPKLYKNLFRQI